MLGKLTLAIPMESVENNMIVINIEKAKEIKKDHLRKEREPLLKQLDVGFIMALESGNTSEQQNIVNKKQILRDITDHEDIVNAQTIDELKNITMGNLTGF